MFRVVWRGLMSRKLRLALTALAISLGVSFVSGTFVLTDTMNSAFTSFFHKTVSNIDVLVRAASPVDPMKGYYVERGTIPEGVLNAVDRAQGVRVAEGMVSGYAQVIDKKGKAITPVGQAPTLGLAADTVPSLGSWTVRQGRAAPQGANEVAMDAGTAKAHDFHLGDRVRVLFEGPTREFTLVSTFGFGDMDTMVGATVVVFDLKTAQAVLGKPGVFDSINVGIDRGYTQEQVRDNVARILGPRYEVITGRTNADQIAQGVSNALGFFSTALLIFGGVAIFVGAFIIFNTFSILVAQRIREFGLLRALGASTTQVTLSVLGEALAVGVLSSIAGIAMGFGIAAGLYALLGAFGMDMPTTTLQFAPRTAAVALAVGVGVTVVAALAPALRSRLISPMAALASGYTSEHRGRLRRRLITGTVLTVLGLGVMLFGLFGGSSQAMLLILGGAILVFVGVASLSALVARWMAAVIGWPVERFFGVAGKLGRQNAMRSPTRTARTAAALMIGLGLVSFVSIFGASLKASASQAIDRTISSDFLILPQSQMGGFSPELASKLTWVPGLQTAAEIRSGYWLRNGTPEGVGGADMLALTQAAKLEVQSGDLQSVVTRSGVAVLDTTARRNGMHVGDVLTVTMPKLGAVQVPVVAIFKAEGVRGEYLISLPFFERSFTQQLDMVVMVRMLPNVDHAAAAAAVSKIVADYPNAKIQDSEQFKADQMQQIDQLLSLIYTLLVLAVIIALFGIVNTLALSVFERVRELGLLRAVGMTRREVRAMVRWEAVVVALLGGVLGMAVGIVFGWMAVLALRDQGLAVFSLPLAQLLVFLVLAGVAGVVAAIGPARRASRVDVLEAIATT